MHARGLLIRSSGLVALSLSLFYGCGGLNEPDVAFDAGEGGPSICGDGKITSSEDCDGVSLNGATCASATGNSASKGVLGCNRSTCQFDVSMCIGGGGAGGRFGGTGGRFGGTGGRFGGTGGGFGGAGGRFGGAGGAFATGGRPTGGTAGRGGAAGAAGSPDDGGTGLSCTSDAGCPRNSSCCGTLTNGELTSTGCAQSCARSDLAVGCAKAADCGRNEVCCGTLNGGQTRYTSLTCAGTCGGRNEITLCTTNAECPQGSRCLASQLLPAEFRVCR
jgi:hypothetical protein